MNKENIPTKYVSYLRSLTRALEWNQDGGPHLETVSNPDQMYKREHHSHNAFKKFDHVNVYIFSLK